MSDKIQSLDEIAPMNQNQQAGDKSPHQSEYNEGKRLLESGETGPAAVALHNALLGFEEEQNENGIANAANQLGLVCTQREEYEKALSHFQRAEEICKKLDDPLSLTWLAKQFIVVYTALEQYKEALDRCLDLLDYYRANNDPRGSIETLEKMAEVYIQAGEKEKAADVYATIASIHRNFKHTKIADEYLHKAEELQK